MAGKAKIKKAATRKRREKKNIESIMVSWDNGSGLSVAYGEDRCKVVADDD